MLNKKSFFLLEVDILADSETEDMEPETPHAASAADPGVNTAVTHVTAAAPVLVPAPVSAPPGFERTRRLLNISPSVSSYRSAESGISGSSVHSGSPQETTGKGISALAAQIRKLKTAAMAPRILGTGDTIKTTNFGSLNMEEDNRSSIVHTRELYEKKINITTSFDPSTLICSNCCNGSHRVLNRSGNHGPSSTGPACFVLSDQCFPAALPSSGIGECLKIIRVEDGSLEDLVTTFMRLTRGCDVTIGTVVLISSINHLGRVGPAAYAEDLVSAISEIRAAFGGQVRAVHGFPMACHVIEDSMTIRGLLEIEAWLKSVDKRRTHSLPATGMYFEEILLTTATPNPAGLLGIPLRLPSSFFSSEKAAFVGLGWANLASVLPALDEAGEIQFLNVLLQELNNDFALQLDTEPVVDRLLHTPEVSSNHSIIVCGGSHANKLAKALGSIRPEVVDLSVGGWILDPDSAKVLEADLLEAMTDLDAEDTTVVLQLFDNVTYQGSGPNGPTRPIKAGGKYHLEGALQIVSAEAFRDLFETALPVIRAARGATILLVGPLHRYVTGKCCGNPAHITNFEDTAYVEMIGDTVKELGKQMKNMVHSRRIKNAKVLNPSVLMGMSGHPKPSIDEVFRLWGMDPVHPTQQAYELMARNILEEMGSEYLVNVRKPGLQAAPALSSKRKHSSGHQTRREGWTETTQTVAGRRGRWADDGLQYSARDRDGAGFGSGNRGRGGRGHWNRGSGSYRGRRNW